MSIHLSRIGLKFIYALPVTLVPAANRHSLPDFVTQAHSHWRANFRQLHYAVAKGYGAILRWLLIQVRNLLGSFVEIFDRFNYCFGLEICPLVLPFDGDNTACDAVTFCFSLKAVTHVDYLTWPNTFVTTLHAELLCTHCVQCTHSHIC